LPATVDEACARAFAAFDAGVVDASLLDRIASRIEADADGIVSIALLETRLLRSALEAELVRTAGQLRSLAAAARLGDWRDLRVDGALRSQRVPIGPVAVFGAGNFPLAFSVAGGDTAAALASGNPVVFKAHPDHPRTCARVAAAISAVAPPGAFSLVAGDHDVGRALVEHPLIEAVAFTGSRAGGLALMRLAAARPRPIPVFAEMGSVNPVLLRPGALRARAHAIAAGLHASFTLRAGQLCTRPGVVLISDGADAFVAHLATLTAATPAAPMLSPRIATGYHAALAHLAHLGAERLASGVDGPGQATLWTTSASRALATPALLDEVFGPSTLLVRCRDDLEIAAVLDALGGQLTVSIHAEPSELTPALLLRLSRLAGRIVFDQFPTGVAVSPAMVHGGPFPASSDARTTSVGARAIDRFTRLVCFQNAPF
jgi:acyl-CoA reductase-like NAD-dependent aldehyde dehydrogenase